MTASPDERAASGGTASGLGESIRSFLTRNVFSMTGGLAFGDWWRMLRRHRFRIHPAYWPRALVITANSLAVSLQRRREERLFAAQAEGVRLQPPIFVLGHWRSGTTHLHNLLSADPRFAAPNFLQASQPHTFLTMEEKLVGSRAAALFTPRTRLIDNMKAGAELPMEDEVALALMSGASPVWDVVFPAAGGYARFLTLRDASDDELRRWGEAFIFFARKLSLRYRRPLVFKSPHHTCRIGLLLKLFPDARFVHVHRHPCEVFRSYSRTLPLMQRLFQLQRPPERDWESWIVAQYREMYDRFFAERDLIPTGRFHEMAYEDLERDPLGEMRRLYERLDLGAFENAEPHLRAHLDSVKGFRKSRLPELPPALEARLRRSWQRCFEEWGYAAGEPKPGNQTVVTAALAEALTA